MCLPQCVEDQSFRIVSTEALQRIENRLVIFPDQCGYFVAVRDAIRQVRGSQMIFIAYNDGALDCVFQLPDISRATHRI